MCCIFGVNLFDRTGTVPVPVRKWVLSKWFQWNLFDKTHYSILSKKPFLPCFTSLGTSLQKMIALFLMCLSYISDVQLTLVDGVVIVVRSHYKVTIYAVRFLKGDSQCNLFTFRPTCPPLKPYCENRECGKIS